MKVEIDLPEIEGFEYTGEWRSPLKGEWYTHGDGVIQAAFDHTRTCSMILRKVEKWRPATLDDVIRVLRGECVPARFRDTSKQDWVYGYLMGGVRDVAPSWMSPSGFRWLYCEVKE